jgi:hypothetical protein
MLLENDLYKGRANKVATINEVSFSLSHPITVLPEVVVLGF